MKTLVHHGVNENRAADITRSERWNDLRTSRWLCCTQVWSWVGGDAIVVVGGPSTSYTIIRIKNRVQIFEGSLKRAMESMGLDFSKYKIVPEHEVKRFKKVA